MNCGGVLKMAASTNKSSKKAKDDHEKPVFVAKSAVDFQRIKLERLMKNPDKPVPIPEAPHDKIMAAPPEFNRNVMGSSAGAGSGEFHVYRHIRRREYARQKYIGERAEKEDKDIAYHRKIEENLLKADERTAKKRSKRMKRKSKAKLLKKTGNTTSTMKEMANAEKDDHSSENDTDDDDDK